MTTNDDSWLINYFVIAASTKGQITNCVARRSGLELRIELYYLNIFVTTLKFFSKTAYLKKKMQNVIL